jgi:anaerobic magnesium-protoporphyrin IX monomethyl ester cyclase
MLDLALAKDWKAALKLEMDQHAYGVVGISFLVTQAAEAFQIAGYLKQNYPGTKVVAGGSFPSSAPRDCLKNPDFDVACCGEGELTTFDLVQAWEQGRPLDAVDGIVFRRQDGQIVQTPPRALIDDLDEMPLPAYHLTDLEPYIRAEHASDFTRQRRRSMELITSRGCPYSCIYCHTIFGKKFRGRSPQHVMDEILLLYNKYQVREFVIWDDTFTMDVQRTKAICDLILGAGIKIHLQLRGGVRVERMDEELMAKLKLAGAETMCVGVESAVDRIQKLIQKNLSIRKVDEFLDLAEKYEITTIGLMMLGFPGEKLEEVKESIRWACASKLNYTFFSMVTPYPATVLYDMAVREGYYVQDDNFESMNVMIPHMEMPELPSKRLKWLQIQGYLRFYCRPRRLRYLLSSTCTTKEFIGSVANYVAVAASYLRNKNRTQVPKGIR